MFSAAVKHPTPASSIAFQSAGMTNGTLEENKVTEEGSDWGTMETSKEEEEELTDSDDDEDDVEEDDDDEEDDDEEDEDDDVKEVNGDFTLGLGFFPELRKQHCSKSLGLSSEA